MSESRSFRIVVLLGIAVVAMTLMAACAGGKTNGATTPAQGNAGTKGQAAAKSTASTTSSKSAGDAPSGGLKPYTGSDDIIGASNAGAKSVTLNIIGSQGNTASGFNFNGYADGNMVIKIPEGWKVSVNFTVDGSLAHSLIVAPWDQRQASSFTKAFPGSAIPDYASGITKGDPAAHFSFTADKAGRYAMVCAIPGHDDLGMWDELDVVAGLNKPEVLVK